MRSIAALAALPLVLGLPATQLNALTAGKYIVVLKQSDVQTTATETINNIMTSLNTQIDATHTFDDTSFKGFAASLSASQANALATDPRVAYVEAEGIMSIFDNVESSKRDTVTQTGAPWGLGRVSHKAKGSTDYVYDSTDGAGTCVYIIDTGINAEHVEFTGRATFLKNMVTGSTATTDDNGHGTHCSGTIGSRAYGVSKQTKLYGIKVLDAQGSGSYADVISGINYAVTDAKTRSCPNGVVASMSLGGGKSQSVNDAVAAAVDAGIFFAVAAGNDGADYHNTSPASEPKAFAVGASDKNDVLAYFSNYGADLGVIAPGVDVLSTWMGSDNATNTISGTSMATPHVAGMAAYLLSLNGAMAPSAMKTLIKSYALAGAITSISDASTPNLLLQNTPNTAKPAPKPAPTPAPVKPAPTAPWWSWPWNQAGKLADGLNLGFLIPSWLRGQL